MKKALFVLLFLAASASTQPRPRFELVYTQYHSPGNHSVDVLHDKETGQEVVCVYGGLDSPSCYLTGRNWK